MLSTSSIAPKWLAFGVIAMSYVTTVMATSMTLIVLPSIAETFDVTLGTVGWVVIIESLIVSALLLPAGGLADSIGRRRVLTGGIALYGVGALLAGLAPSFAFLIIARVVMAFGNMMVQSIGTGLLVAAFPPEERGLALGAQSTAVALGSTMGPILGGLALDVLSWQTLFLLVSIPSFLSAIAARILITDAAESTGPARRFDRIGAALSAFAVTALVVTINNPFGWSWQSPALLVGAVATVVALVSFVRWELQVDQPMLELRLFAEPAFRQGVIIRVFSFLGTAAVRILFPIYLLSARELSGSRTGLLLALNALGLGVAAQVSGRLYDRVGPLPPAMVGLISQGVGLTFLAFADLTTSLPLLAALSLWLGVSMGLWNVPTNSAMLGATPPEALGVGGAFTNVTRTVGSVVGQATAAAVVVAVMTSKGFDIPLGDIDEVAGATSAFVDGWKVTFLGAAGISALLVLVALGFPSPRAHRASTHAAG